MLTEKELKEIGKRACVNWIGQEFLDAHRDGACLSYGYAMDGRYEVFLGVDTDPSAPDPTGAILISEDPFPVQVAVSVNPETGSAQLIPEALRREIPR